MTRVDRAGAIALAALTLAAPGVALAATGARPHSVAIAHAAAACGQEDGASWDWARCGNRRRGVVLTDGRRVAVTAPQLCALLGQHRVRSAPPLRGDSRVCS